MSDIFDLILANIKRNRPDDDSDNNKKKKVEKPKSSQDKSGADLDIFIIGDESQKFTNQETELKKKKGSIEFTEPAPAILDDVSIGDDFDTKDYLADIEQINYIQLDKMPKEKQLRLLKKEYIVVLDRIQDLSKDFTKVDKAYKDQSVDFHTMKKTIENLKEFIRLIASVIPDGTDLKTKLEAPSWTLSDIEDDMISRLNFVANRAKNADDYIEQQTQELTNQIQGLKNKLTKVENRNIELEQEIEHAFEQLENATFATEPELNDDDEEVYDNDVDYNDDYEEEPYEDSYDEYGDETNSYEDDPEDYGTDANYQDDESPEFDELYKNEYGDAFEDDDEEEYIAPKKSPSTPKQRDTRNQRENNRPSSPKQPSTRNSRNERPSHQEKEEESFKIERPTKPKNSRDNRTNRNQDSQQNDRNSRNNRDDRNERNSRNERDNRNDRNSNSRNDRNERNDKNNSSNRSKEDNRNNRNDRNSNKQDSRPNNRQSDNRQNNRNDRNKEDNRNNRNDRTKDDNRNSRNRDNRNDRNSRNNEREERAKRQESSNRPQRTERTERNTSKESRPSRTNDSSIKPERPQRPSRTKPTKPIEEEVVVKGPELDDTYDPSKVMDVEPYLESLSEEAKYIVRIVGEVGVSRNNELKDVLTEREDAKPLFFSGTKFQKNPMQNAVNDLINSQIFNSESLKLATRGTGPKVYELSELGKHIYFSLTNEIPVKSELSLLIKQHASAEHGYLIKDSADIFRNMGYTVYTDRKDLRHDIGGGNRKDFDLIIEKDGEKSYIEVERGTHNEEDFFHAMDKIRQITDEFYFICPNETILLNKTKRHFFMWIQKHLGGMEFARGIKANFTTFGKLKEGKTPLWDDIEL